MLGILPEALSFALKRIFEEYNGDIYELRLIGGKCVYLVTSDGIRFISEDGRLLPSIPGRPFNVASDGLEELVERAVGYSGFAHEAELKQSFATRPDGTRIGIAFSGGEGGIKMGSISSVNIRLPVRDAEVDCPEINGLLREMNGGILLAGGPNTGKTTLLRYCCRYLANGYGGSFRKVCAIDERMELSGGDHVFDLGACTDVISGRSKQEGILTALRLLSPDVIVCDEIGSKKETDCILEGLNSGVVLIASIHANDLTQLLRREQFVSLFRENVFSHVAILAPREKGKISRIYRYEEVADEVYRYRNDFRRGDHGCGIRECQKEAAYAAAFEAV